MTHTCSDMHMWSDVGVTQSHVLKINSNRLIKDDSSEKTLRVSNAMYDSCIVSHHMHAT